MAWYIEKSGTFAQVISAVTQIPIPSNPVDSAALSSAQSYMLLLLNSPPPSFANVLINLKASGCYDGNSLRFEMKIDGLDGLLNGQIMNTPDKAFPDLPT